MALSKTAIRQRKSHQMKIPLLNPDDVGLCNCAMCGCELLGERTRILLDGGDIRVGAGGALPPDVGGRIMDRPYCQKCLDHRNSEAADMRIPQVPGVGRGDMIGSSWRDEASGRQENNIHIMEDGE